MYVHVKVVTQNHNLKKKEVIQANNEIIDKCLSKIKYTLHIPETHSICMSNLWHCSLLQDCSANVKTYHKNTSSVFGKALDKFVPQ